jgi:hypothetical protein
VLAAGRASVEARWDISWWNCFPKQTACSCARGLTRIALVSTARARLVSQRVINIGTLDGERLFTNIGKSADNGTILRDGSSLPAARPPISGDVQAIITHMRGLPVCFSMCYLLLHVVVSEVVNIGGMYVVRSTTPHHKPDVTLLLCTSRQNIPAMPSPFSLADSKQIECAKTMSARSSTHPPLR